MDIHYTFHAEYQLNERKVEKIWVEETIKSPDQTKRTGNKYYIIKKINGKTLKVVYVKERNIKVVTIYWV